MKFNYEDLNDIIRFYRCNTLVLRVKFSQAQGTKDDRLIINIPDVIKSE